MKISDCDKNFLINKDFNTDGLKFYSIPDESFDLYGVFYDEDYKGFLRMPRKVSEKVSDGVHYLATNTAGGRLRFSTDSKNFCICAKWRDFSPFPHMPISGSSGFVLVEDLKDGTQKFVCSIFPTFEEKEGFIRQIPIYDEKKKRNFTLFFPLYQGIDELTIGIDKDASVDHGVKYKDVLPILYYGSSITQGGCASRPDTAYFSLISKWINTDYINLGFSGCAKGEDAIIEYLAKQTPSIFVCDYDFNAPSVEHLQNTHEKLFKAFRKNHPDTPVILISHPGKNYEADERYFVIEKTYKNAISKGDKNVYLIDGRKFFAEAEYDCQVDGVHPTDLGFYFMAKSINAVISKILK